MTLWINGRETWDTPYILGSITLVNGDLDLSTSGTGVYDIILTDAVADALSIRRAATDMMVFNTSTPQITITPAVTMASTLVVTGNATLDGVALVKDQVRFNNANNIGAIQARPDTNAYVRLDAPLTGTLTEIARLIGNTTDPYFAANSQQDGRTFGFLYGNVAITNFKVAKVTMAHTGGLFDAVATTDSATIWTQPVNSRLIAVMMKVTAQFVAAGLTNLTVTMGDAGDNDGLLTTTGNLTSDAVNTEYENAGAYHAAFTEGLASKRANASGTKAWIAYAAATGANLDTTSAGSIDFYFLYEEA